MFWTLVVFMGIAQGGAITTIPMQDQEACIRANIEIREKANITDVWPHALCINTHTGEVK